MNTHNFIVHIKINDIYVDTTKYVEIRFGTSNYELERPLLREKNREVIGLIKDKLSGKTMVEFVALRRNICIYLTDDGDENEKSKRHKKMCHKTKPYI